MTTHPQKDRPDYLFMDTQVFEQLNHCYEQFDLLKLRQLAAEGYVKVLMPTITASEVVAHLEERAAEVASAAAKLAQLPAVRALGMNLFVEPDRKLLAESLRGKLRGQFQSFCEDCRTISVDLKHVDADGVFVRYFANEAPFDVQRKKNEFPDAFTAAALRVWKKRNHVDVVVIISRDDDWKRMTNQDAGFRHFDTLRGYLGTLTEQSVAAAIKQHIRGRWEVAVAPAVEGWFSGSAFWPGDVDGEVDEVEVTEIDIEDIFVVQAEDGVYRAEVDVTVYFKAYVSFDVPGTGSYDHETGAIYNAERFNGWVADTKSASVSVLGTFAGTDSARVGIAEVIPPQRFFHGVGRRIERGGRLMT
jgi:hypothetical protein